MKKIILVLLVLTFKLSFAQTGWFWQNPKPQGQTLRDVKIINSTTVLAAGDNGVFMKSTNSGNNWTVQNLIPVTETDYSQIYRFNFITENIIFALASSTTRNTLTGKYKLYKSSDGGTSWTSQFIDNSSSFLYTDMKFVNENTGYCFDIYDRKGKIIKTTNSGASWERLSILGNDSLSFIFFADENTGYASAYDYYNYYKTTNSGASWTAYLDSNMIGPDKFYFFNGNTGYCNSYSGFFKTTNGGTNWTQKSSAITDVRRFEFTNEETGWYTVNRNLYITTNGGTNWTLSLNTADVIGVNFLNSETGYATGDWGKLYKTVNCGNNWQQVRQNNNNQNNYGRNHRRSANKHNYPR
jgi:photosystem II stability/assembly factor-like uncharacterized protein